MSRQDDMRDMRDMLAAFSRTLEEANQELIDDVRLQLQDLRREIAEVRAELRIARAEAARALGEAAAARSGEPLRAEAGEEPAAVPEPSQQLQEELRQRHAEIWRLLGSGESPAEVARRTNRPLGEVELIMRLIGPRPGLPERRGR